MKTVKIQKRSEIFVTFVPIFLAWITLLFHVIFIIPIIIPLIFILVGILPFVHGHENLWLFLISTETFIPLDLLILFQHLDIIDYLCAEHDIGIFFILTLIEALLILISIEDIVIAFIGRMIWRRQYKLPIPEIEDE